MARSNSASTEKGSAFHWAWAILLICFLDLFINFSIRLGYGVVLPEIIRDLGFTRTEGGTIFNAYFLTYLAFILGVGALLMGTTRSLGTACLFYAVVGLGATGMWAPVITVVQRWFAPTHRGRALGVLSTGYGLGFAVMGAIFPWIVHAFTWRFAWYFLGVGALIMVIINGLFLKSDPASTGHTPWGTKEGGTGEKSFCASQAPGTGFAEGVLRHRTFWLIGLSYLAVSYSLYGMTTFLVDYAKNEIGLSLERASFLATVHGLCQIIGVLTILPLSDYLGRKKTILLSNLFIAGSIAGILIAADSWVALYASVGVMAVFYGVTFPIYGACAGDYFPGKWMGTVIGAWTPFYGLGAILAHWAGGMIRDTTGSYSGAFTINMIMAGLGFLLFCAVGGTDKGST
jgi:sugar phosphate permease